MTYDLKHAKGGIRSERTYDLNINVPRPRVKQSAAAQRRKTEEAALRVAELKRRERERALALRRRREREAEAEQNIRTVSAENHVPLPMGIIFMVLICTAMFMYIIFNMVQLTERRREVNNMESALAQLEVQKKDVQNKLDKKNDLHYIEDYAVNALGMVKVDQLTSQYVSIENEDKIEVVEGGERPDGALGGVMSVIKSAGGKLSELWEYIS